MGEAGRESETGLRVLGMDAAIAALAARQHAVFGLEQLKSLGLGERTIQHRAALGRIYRGVYSLIPARLLSRDRRRDQRLSLIGWRPIRVTWRQIDNEAARLAATIAALLNL